MAKEYTIRSRVNDILHARLKAFVESENARGRGVKDSDVIRDAVVEFLDNHERDDELKPWRLNDRKADEVAEKAAEMAVEKITNPPPANTSSSKEGPVSEHARKLREKPPTSSGTPK